MTRSFRAWLLAAVAAYGLQALTAREATAQTQVKICIPTSANPSGCQSVDAGNPLPVSATVSVAGFTPNGNYATLTATGSSASVALPAGATVQFQNLGTTAVSCTLGVGSATALVSELTVQPGGQRSVAVGANTFGACIDQTGSASNLIALAGGAGLGGDTGGSAATNGTIVSPLGHGTADAAAVSIVPSATAVFPVTGTFWQATQPISATSLPLPTGAALDATVAATNTALAAINTLISATNTALATINTTAGGAVAAGANLIGYFGGDGTAGVPTTHILTVQPPTSNLISGVTAAMTGTTSTSVIALVSSKKLYITHVSCVNSHATVGTFINFQDGSGGTTLWTVGAAAVYGGEADNGGSIPLFSTSSGVALFAADVTTGANVVCKASGFSGT